MEKTETQYIRICKEADPFALYRGGVLENVQVAYETYGCLNEAKDNAILVFHALSLASFRQPYVS